MGEKWADLTGDEKREERFKKWLSPDVQFSSPVAAKLYTERVTRFIDTIQLKVPDRVPCILPTGLFPALYAGINLRTAIYDYDELRRAWFKFIHEFDMDTYSGPGTVLPGRVFEKLDFKQYLWPGHGLAENIASYQYVEREYMQAD
ncbi:MAG: hypothetical protein MUO90_03665, partial [Dehalococcoidales bacterium]|nr:hypothetical protein [Dehalococcoidales bacterium]